MTPLGFIEELVKKFHDEFDEVEFSRYVSGGQGITLSRQIFRLRKDDLLSQINAKMLTLSSSEELAIHSNLYKDDRQVFLPIIDFSFKELNIGSLEICNDIFKYFNAPLFIYHTGHSYHGYVLKLIKSKEWIKFLGKLLLYNSPTHPYENIDSRWIGHSLENGFSALRLTLNSDFYLKRPEFLKRIE